MLAAFLAGYTFAASEELSPAKIIRNGGVEIGHYSERTITAAVQIDRDHAELLAFTVKPRPFERIQSADVRQQAISPASEQLEVRLHNQSGRWIAVPLEIRGLCLEHSAETPPHVAGDTVRRHREAFLVELPEVPGFDQVEVAILPTAASQGSTRRVVGKGRLKTEKFTAAGTTARYDDLAFAERDSSSRPPPQPPSTSGAIHWPEEYGDTNRYLVFGNEAEATNRINIVLIPDGYTYSQKSLARIHAANLVSHFRGRTPFKEHDNFINYILVYAYSTEDGTDQCDCGIVRDTAMNTGFVYGNGICGSDANRLLDYGSMCDHPTNGYYVNVTAAEMRAPAWDHTIILVNTTRYGGSGGSRSVYAAGNSSATEIALHEIGHSIAGLDDEYGGYPNCGSSAGGFNTSLNPTAGAWPEWIADLGQPWEGAQYYDFCVYRPTANCKMRILNAAYCPVCAQRWATTIFGHWRIVRTAPAVLEAPATPLTVAAGVSTAFSVKTRLSTLASNTITWAIHASGGVTNIVATNTPAYTHTFTVADDYVVACEVVADVNFVKPSRNGGNYDLITWNVTVAQGAPRPSLQILSTASAGTYELVLTNLTQGIQYFVEGAPELAGNNWSQRMNFIAAGNATNIVVTSTNTTETFYRVRRSN